MGVGSPPPVQGDLLKYSLAKIIRQIMFSWQIILYRKADLPKAFELLMNGPFITLSIIIKCHAMSYTVFKQVMIEQFITKLVAIQIDGHQTWESFLENNNSN